MTPRAASRDLSAILAARARDQGITSSHEHAEEAAPGWGDRAFSALVAYAARRRKPFTIEEARPDLYRYGVPVPPDERAWGGVVTRARHHGAIVPVGWAPASSSHLSPKPTYRGAAVGARRPR